MKISKNNQKSLIIMVFYKYKPIFRVLSETLFCIHYFIRSITAIKYMAFNSLKERQTLIWWCSWSLCYFHQYDKELCNFNSSFTGITSKSKSVSEKENIAKIESFTLKTLLPRKTTIAYSETMRCRLFNTLIFRNNIIQ